MKNFFKQRKYFRERKKLYKILWKPVVHFDKRAEEGFVLIPTIAFTSWRKVHIDVDWDFIWTFAWLNFYIGIGRVRSLHKDDF